MVDKDLFLYDLSVVAIMKSEGPYLKEWLDYHLLAGVDHFYIYDNESPDNQAEVAKPYVDAGLVTYIPFPGQLKQMPAYNDAVKKFKFQCRYMAFIDGDEFIFPKYNGGGRIIDVVDETLSRDPKAVGLAINWHVFGSNNQETADYSRGVLERFTRRAPNDYCFIMKEQPIGGNPHVKSIVNPRMIAGVHNPHFATYFKGFHAVNANGGIVEKFFNTPVIDDKIIINHYFTKSREEFELKVQRGRADVFGKYNAKSFKHAYLEVFDDGILAYRDERAKIYQPPKARSAEDLIKALKRNLSTDSYAGKLETFLTCRAVAAYLNEKTYEEVALKAIVKAMENSPSAADKQMFDKELPELLKLPYPVIEELRKF